jgi:hypothetical protein
VCGSGVSDGTTIRLELSAIPDLHCWPAIVPRDLVPTELLLTIGVPNVRVDVVVVKDPAFDRIVVNTLSTRAINIVVRLEHNGTTTRKARRAGSVDLQTIISTFRTHDHMSPPKDNLQIHLLPKTTCRL